MEKQPFHLTVTFRALYSRHYKALIGIVAAAAALFLAQVRFILPIKTVNGSFYVSNYQIIEEDLNHPRLQLLRAREKLDEVMRPGVTEFDKLVLLRAWARRQWEPSPSEFYYPPWDAVEILDLARKYKNRAFCAQYAVVYLQACLSVGRHARYVDLPGHFVTAVWSDDFSKWVVMDPYNDIHYERDGVPLSGTELYDAYNSRNTEGIVKVSYGGLKQRIALEDISLYQGYSILLRTDHLTNPVFLTVNGVEVRFPLNHDHRTYPVLGRDQVAISDSFLNYVPASGQLMKNRIYTKSKNDFKRDLNQTIIYYMKSSMVDSAVKVLILTDDAPYFSHFLISANGEPWTKTDNSKIMWELKPGVNKLSARVVTKFGWQGRISAITLYNKVPWLFNSREDVSKSLKSL